MKSQELLDGAAVHAGLDDFGDRSFVEPLDTLLDSVLSEGHLGHAGRAGLNAEIVRHLVNRLRLVRDLRAHPEILEEQVDDPIVIVGLPRTGTTKLQRLIAQDPMVQSVPLWKALNPAPLPEPDPRVAVAEQFVAQMADFAPDFLAAHPTGATEPDEEMLIQLGAFDGPASWANFYRAPSYLNWVKARPAQPSYEFLKTMLQYLQWQDGGRQERIWVLKSPMHLAHLDAITAAFPHAVVVHCHRDLDVGVPSTCRLIEVARAARGNERNDPEEIGRTLLDLWANEWNANIRQRPDVGADARVLDVAYSKIAADPAEVIEEIYKARGLTIQLGAAERLVEWERSHPVEQGRHAYSLERFHLTSEQIRTAFAGYHEKFGDFV